VELLTNYLEGALPPAAHAVVEQHLHDCDGCTRYLDQLRHAIRATGTLREDTLDPVAMATIVAAFRSWNRSSSG
jgi:anti-sigma factor RsiW